MSFKFKLIMFYIFIRKMKINKKIIIFTNNFPTGNLEDTFIKFELSKLSRDFNEIEIIPQKNLKRIKKLEKNISINLDFSKQFNKKKIIKFFFFRIIFSNIFYKEIFANLFKKNFIYKFKMMTIELTKSEIAYNWFLENRIYLKKNIIFYSFWSDYLLLSFEKLKKISKIKTISRTLGSDLNGFIKDDDYVPYIKKKFYSLNKVFVLGSFQKKILISKNLIQKKKITVCPLGVYKQNNYQNYLKKKILFLSCNSFIKIKNTLMIIKFLKKLAIETDKKILYYIIGEGEEKKAIISSLDDSKNLFNFKLINRVENLIDFIRQKKINFFINFSSKEGMSFSIMEAMSCGIPIISSDINANNDLVKNNSGYLINLENFEISSDTIIKRLIYDIKFKKNYYRKCKNSKNFINKYLINNKCYEKFKKEIISI